MVGWFWRDMASQRGPVWRDQPPQARPFVPPCYRSHHLKPLLVSNVDVRLERNPPTLRSRTQSICPVSESRGSAN